MLTIEYTFRDWALLIYDVANATKDERKIVSHGCSWNLGGLVANVLLVGDKRLLIGFLPVSLFFKRLSTGLKLVHSLFSLFTLFKLFHHGPCCSY